MASFAYLDDDDVVDEEPAPSEQPPSAEGGGGGAAPAPGGAAAPAEAALLVGGAQLRGGGGDGDEEMDADEWDQQLTGAGKVVSGRRWALWFDADLTKGLTLREYEESIQQLGEVTTLDQLLARRYADYHAFSFVPEDESLATGRTPVSGGTRFRFNLRLFRSGCMPFWEDPAHAAGLIITLKMPESVPPIQFKLFWKALARSIITRRAFNCDSLVEEDDGEGHEPFDTAGLNGVVVHYGRNKGHGTIEVWTQEIGPSAERILHDVKTKIIPQARYRYVDTFKSVERCLSDNAAAREGALAAAELKQQTGDGLNRRKDRGDILHFQKSDLGGAHAVGRYDPYHKSLDRAYRKELRVLSTAFEREQLRSDLRQELRHPDNAAAAAAATAAAHVRAARQALLAPSASGGGGGVAREQQVQEQRLREQLLQHQLQTTMQQHGDIVRVGRPAGGAAPRQPRPDSGVRLRTGPLGQKVFIKHAGRGPDTSSAVIGHAVVAAGGDNDEEGEIVVDDDDDDGE